MRIVESLLLLVCLGELWYFVRNDAAEYAAFKLLSNTKDRQRSYRTWIAKGFLLFSGTALAGLAILHRLHSLAALPPEFAALLDPLRAYTSQIHLGSGFLIGMSIPIIIGMIAGAFVMRLMKRGPGSPALAAGDVQPLMPRNWPETAHTALLSLNAGLSEELFFRLLLPLLLVLLTGNAIFAFIAAAIIFGAVHAYQGWVGVLATTILGFVLTALYLATRSIWIAIAVHAGIDLLGLVVRPTLVRLITVNGRPESPVDHQPVS